MRSAGCLSGEVKKLLCTFCALIDDSPMTKCSVRKDIVTATLAAFAQCNPLAGARLAAMIHPGDHIPPAGVRGQSTHGLVAVDADISGLADVLASVNRIAEQLGEHFTFEDRQLSLMKMVWSELLEGVSKAQG